MINLGFLRSAAAAAVIAACAATASAQTVPGAHYPAGANPVSIAVNPITNKVYVANADADTVTVINANTHTTTTIPVGDYPAWIAINSETNKVYVSNLLGANTTIIDGATDTVSATAQSGGGGWTAINPVVNTAYVLRYGGGDEVNVIIGEHYEVTSATRSRQPTALAVNPTNNWLYIVHQTTGDVVAMDITTPQPYPELKCPDGSGGFRAQPPIPPLGTPDTWNTPCIDVPDTPVAIAVNPVTNKIYALSNTATNPISVINGANSTFTSLTPPGTLGTAKAIAVNPVTNKIYAAFSAAVVVIDGASNGMTVIPAGSGTGGPAAIGVEVLRNMVYVPNTDGTLLAIDGATNSTEVVSIPAGARAVAVNPATRSIYVLDPTGVTEVAGAPGSSGTFTATGITTTITPLPGDTGNSSGSITLNASSSITPAPLNTVRKVYFRFDSAGPWTEASGSGPWTASYSGLAPGAHTMTAFATNSLEAPSINTDLANVPVIGNFATYGFTVSGTNAKDLEVTQSQSVNPASSGKDVVYTITATNHGPGTASSVTVTDMLPGGTSFIWASPGCSYGSGSVTCGVGSLAEGASVQVKVVLRPAAAGAISNQVSVFGAEPDSVSSNNTSALGVTVNASPAGVAVLRYRLYSPGTQEHLYTTDQNEYNVLGANGWTQEGTVGKVLNNPGSFNGVTGTPYYRLYNSSSHWHHWTTDANEYYTLIQFPNWNGEGVDGYILPTTTAGATQLYRLVYPDGRGLHHWTIDTNEYNTLIGTYGWIGEGGSGFVIQ